MRTPSKSLRLWLAGLLLVPALVLAEPFTVTDIRIQGLQRISPGTVFNLLPVNVGDTLDEVAVRQLVRLLFRSGFFHDIRMDRDGGILIVTVAERPAIESIEIEGNKSIPTEALMDGLGQQGLKDGEIFKQATLEKVDLELERQYVGQGRYGASIEADVEYLPRNRVDIKINIEEGKTSGIRHLNIVGNSVYEQGELLDILELKHPSLLSFYKNDDKYSREKLSGDLERLESYYRDRGYVEFDITSTQVSITPDKQQVYITINVAEGDSYTVGEVEVIGELRDMSPEYLQALILVAPGQTFSQALVTASEERLTQALGNSGYTFATASGIPETSTEGGVVDVTFFIEAGKRAYVRRVEFAGNGVTQDEVLRREMRQMEGGWASSALINLSKVRLERLGYFKGVNVETPEVPGTDDQVDIAFSVEEQPSGSISATLGFSQGSGLILGANYQENNVFGTGNSLGVGISWSEFQRAITFNYFNPYFTLDGISRGYNLFYRTTDFDEQNLATYSTDAYGAGIDFGFPIGETRRMGFGFLVEYTDITEGQIPALEISQFLRQEGNEFLNFKTNLTWSSSTLNRGLFPTRGRSQSLQLQVAVPGSDLEFYKIRYQGQMYFPMPFVFSDIFTIKLRTELGFGDAYGNSDTFPFYEHFFAGGFGSVRGFESNTLGPKSTPNPFDFNREFDPFGGNLLIEGSLEVIFPLPFIEDNRSFRPVVFLDGGQVFNTNCPEVSVFCEGFDFSEIRYSAGVGITWLAGLGPMTFAFSFPLNADDLDQEESFQFELGRTF